MDVCVCKLADTQYVGVDLVCIFVRMQRNTHNRFYCFDLPERSRKLCFGANNSFHGRGWYPGRPHSHHGCWKGIGPVAQYGDVFITRILCVFCLYPVSSYVSPLCGAFWSRRICNRLCELENRLCGWYLWYLQPVDRFLLAYLRGCLSGLVDLTRVVRTHTDQMRRHVAVSESKYRSFN